jgi:hypothetical protein
VVDAFHTSSSLSINDAMRIKRFACQVFIGRDSSNHEDNKDKGDSWSRNSLTRKLRAHDLENPDSGYDVEQRWAKLCRHYCP